MAGKTFNYPELQKQVDLAYARAVQSNDSIPGAIAYDIWCWIHNAEVVTDHSPVEAKTEPVGYVGKEEYLRNLLANQEVTDKNVEELRIQVENLQNDVYNIKTGLSRLGQYT